jgi:colicin import membrane protein
MAPAEPSQNPKNPAPPAKPKDQSIDLKKKKTSSIEKIKQFEKEERKRKALESIRDEVRKQDLQEKSEKVKKLLAKGNVISAGTALTGTAKTEFNEYIGVLHSTVQEHWNLPEWLSNANLKATVVVYLDSQGNIKKRAIEKSSGDSRFDQYSLKAVDDSAPFPPPPEKFRDIVSADGIRFRFPQ